MSWEVSLMVWIQEHLGDFGVSVMSFFTMFGEELVVVAIIMFIYLSYNKKYGEYVIINLLTGLTWGPVIKNLACRKRPYFDHPEVKCLKKVEAEGDLYDVAVQGYSFPSMHSTTAFTSYFSIARCIKKRWLNIVATILVLGVGISRFSLGVHYPTDVLTGYLIGFLAMAFVGFLNSKIEKKWIRFAIIVATCVPGFFFANTDDFYSCFGLLVGCTLGILFENKFVNFKDTRKPLYMIIRLLIGVGLFVGILNGLKLFFSEELLNSGRAGGFYIRMFRYALAVFITVGPGTFLFGLYEKDSK